MTHIAIWAVVAIMPVLLIVGSAHLFERRWFLQVAGWCSGAVLTTLSLRLYRIRVLHDFDPKFSHSVSDAVQLGIADAAVASTLASYLFAGTLWVLLRLAPITVSSNCLLSIVVAVIIATVAEIVFQRQSLLTLCILAVIYAVFLRSLTDRLRA
jgi:hypothetical protein